MKTVVLTLVGMVFSSQFSQAQELLVPLQTAPVESRRAPKSTPAAVALPFFDDFAGSQGQPAPQRWQSAGVTVDHGERLLPPTVGVATLDALDASGRLYSNNATSLFAADTLLSLPLRLDGLSPADSVVMSFYYLPGGGEGNMWERLGDCPDIADSLLLDFYRPADSSWVTVWARGGTSVEVLVDSTGLRWQYVAVPLTDNGWFDSTFRFRFRNYCSIEDNSKPGMAGNCDFWHIDYVLVDRNRTSNPVPVFRDVAFVSPAPSMLSRYRTMPARQYRPSEMASALSMTITNLYSSALASQYGYAVVGEAGDTLYRYSGGYENAPAFLPGAVYQTAPAHAAPQVQYAFPLMNTPTSYTVVHAVREGVAGDEFSANDTVCYRQVFGNYYAYDDGTPENGYGLTSTSSMLLLAYRFDLNEEDTLTAVDIFFNRTLEGENEQVPFYITVWRKEGNEPGEVLYRDQAHRTPVSADLNRYHRYVLENPVVVSDSIFVGFEQGNNYFINMGFDRSFNTSRNIYYLTGTEWQQSILSGSLMMRPCFGAAATVAVEPLPTSDFRLTVYPNPASESVTIGGLPEGSRVDLYDAMGRLVFSTPRFSFSTSNMPNGLYLLRCVAPTGAVHSEKLIIRH